MPATKPVHVATNRILATLPLTDRKRFLSSCKPVELAHGEVLAESGERLSHVYFPIKSSISLLTPIIDGHTSLKIGLIGDEGMLGIHLILGVDVSPLRAVVQCAGQALRMDIASFLREFRSGRALQQELNRYLYVILTQFAQSAACNRFHVVEERLARFLLMTHDRAHSDAFHVTHEYLACMLGVRRVGVTKAASSLQRRNLIQYSRGNVTVLDRRGLEAAACACYAADNAVYRRLMG
ncbi:MAG: Crp/Fnr family transcriptional regulator [Gammaproteobacteria bacterium]|nr:Crp/Fnr family transcriptional regulator [Gammaproteobacteria bacterium]